jgi:hypothetical protein
MNAIEFLESKGLSTPTIELMEEYAQFKKK